jgi:hypothetical protein
MSKHPSALTTELTTLAAELNDLNARRQVVTQRISKLVAALVGEDDLKPRRRPGARRKARVVRLRKGGRPKGFTVSAATKAKLRAAWKKRKAAAEA